MTKLLPSTVDRWYAVTLRAIYAIAVALLVVCAGGRPREVEIRDEQNAQLVVAPPGLAVSIARRGGAADAPDGDVRPPRITPTSTCDADPPPVSGFEIARGTPHCPFCSFLPTRSSRGPPRSRS